MIEKAKGDRSGNGGSAGNLGKNPGKTSADSPPNNAVVHPAKARKKADRAERLSAALRENLKRRKAQAKAQAQSQAQAQPQAQSQPQAKVQANIQTEAQSKAEPTPDSKA